MNGNYPIRAVRPQLTRQREPREQFTIVDLCLICEKICMHSDLIFFVNPTVLNDRGEVIYLCTVLGFDVLSDGVKRNAKSIIIPIYFTNHWILILVDLTTKKKIFNVMFNQINDDFDGKLDEVIDSINNFIDNNFVNATNKSTKIVESFSRQPLINKIGIERLIVCILRFVYGTDKNSRNIEYLESPCVLPPVQEFKKLLDLDVPELFMVPGCFIKHPRCAYCNLDTREWKYCGMTGMKHNLENA